MKCFQKKYINLLREITYSQFKIKDQSTFFGFIWSFLHPLILLAVLFIVFKQRMGGKIDHYAIFILIGTVHYTYFANGTCVAMNSLFSMRELTCNVIFPKEILVIGSVLATSVEFILSFLACVLIAYLSGVHLSWTIALLPFVFIVQLAMILWVSLVLSGLQVFVRDISHVYQVFLRVLFFATPIFYEASFVTDMGEGITRYVFLLNPLTHLMTFSRQIIIEGRMFPVGLFFLLLVAGLVMIYASLKLFRKLEPDFAEHI